MRLEHGELAAALLQDPRDAEEVLGALAAGQPRPVLSYARRAAVTARSTSAFEACATLASRSSVAGLMTSNVALGRLGRNSLPMNSPYSGRRVM